MIAPSVPVSAKCYAALSVGFTLFTIYGSLVPFEYVPRTWDNAVAAWGWVWEHRIYPESRSDFAANFLLGVPLGFCLLGALRLDRKGPFGSLLAVLIALPFCIGLATAVEFSQLWFPKRTCAGSDVIAQSLGSASGMLVWLLAGQWITNFVRRIWDLPSLGGRVGRALVLYLIALAAVMTLPWDITASPADWYHKALEKITYVPFEEWNRPELRVRKLRDWAELLALFAPVGLLASGLPGSFKRRGGIGIVGFAGLALGVMVEGAQWPIVSRHPSATDVIIEASSVLIGWGIGRAIASGKLPVVIPTFGWLGLLAGVNWWPMNFDPGVLDDRLRVTTLLPFLSLESKNYMFWLEEIAVKAMVFAPIGAAASRKGIVRAMIVCAMAGLMMELGQLFLSDRFPSLTDVLLATVGGGLGAMVTRAVLSPDEPLLLEKAA